MLSDVLAARDDVDEGARPSDERVDLEILRTAVARDLWLPTELHEYQRDPLVHLPGTRRTCRWPGRSASRPTGCGRSPPGWPPYRAGWRSPASPPPRHLRTLLRLE